MGLVIIELFFETNLTNIIFCVLITRVFYWITLPQMTKKIKYKLNYNYENREQI